LRISKKEKSPRREKKARHRWSGSGRKEKNMQHLHDPTHSANTDSCIPPFPEKEAAAEQHATGCAEVSIEERREQMAQLDQPAEEIVDEVDRRVSCVANTIRRQVEGLTRMDAERFFAALRDRLDDAERAKAQGGALMSTTTPPSNSERRMSDTIAVFDHALRCEGDPPLTRRELEAELDNLVRARREQEAERDNLVRALREEEAERDNLVRALRESEAERDNFARALRAVQPGIR
jgi:hypothetical protein